MEKMTVLQKLIARPELLKMPRKTVTIEKDGEEMDFVVRALSIAEQTEMEKKWTDQGTGKLDEQKYYVGLLAQAIVEPNLNDKELKTALGIANGMQFVERCLTDGDVKLLTNAVGIASGTIKKEDPKELIKDAKNN